MKYSVIKLPEKISCYMRDHYPGYSLINSKEEKDSTGRSLFFVDLLQSDKYCHLKIDEAGKLIQEEVEPHFNNDYKEQYF